MPPHTRAKVIAIAAGAAAAIVALLPVRFTSDVDGVTRSCGPAISAAFHRWPGCQEAAPPYLIAAVVIAAAGAILAVSMSKKDD
jgi:cell division protein FtsX